MKSKEFFDGSYFMTPRNLSNVINKLSRPCFVIMNHLFIYFSTEAGRKTGIKEYTLNELVILCELSKSTIVRTVNEIAEKKIFIVKIDVKKFGTKYIFMVINQKNIADLNKISSPDLESSSSNLESHSSNLESSSSFLESNDKVISKVITTVAPLPKSPQDNLLKITIKDNFIKEVNTLSSSTISNSSLPLNLDKEKIEKVKSKLKDFGVVGIDNLIKYNSLEIIEKQIMYHEFREFKNGSLLYNAIKNNEEAPVEYLAYLRFEENKAWVNKYYNFYSLFGINPTTNANDRKKELTKFLLYNLYQFGYLELNIPALNQELRFHQANNLKFIETRVIKPIKYFLTNFKIDELITILESGIEILRQDRGQCDRKDTIFKCFNNYGVNVFNLKKSILKINSMELSENENK